MITIKIDHAVLFRDIKGKSRQFFSPWFGVIKNQSPSCADHRQVMNFDRVEPIGLNAGGHAIGKIQLGGDAVMNILGNVAKPMALHP